MKTKIILFLGAVALVTLSFTFSSLNSVAPQHTETATRTAESAPVGGIVADQIVR